MGITEKINEIRTKIDEKKAEFDRIKQDMITTYPSYRASEGDAANTLYNSKEQELIKLFNDLSALKANHNDVFTINPNEIQTIRRNMSELKDLYNPTKTDLKKVSNKYYASYSLIKLGLDNKIKNEKNLIFLTLSLFFLLNLLKRLITLDNTID